jgi:hypothetical protein
MKKISQEELDKLIKTKIKSLKGLDVSGLSLRGADLSGADLSTILNGADLSGANLVHANLNWAQMTGADLSVSKLGGAILSLTSLSDANLKAADLRGADLSSTILVGADLSGSDLSGAKLNNPNLNGANLSGANLSDANLEKANLFESSLEKANLNGAIYNKNTKWPDGFNPKAAGARLVQEESKMKFLSNLFGKAQRISDTTSSTPPPKYLYIIFNEARVHPLDALLTVDTILKFLEQTEGVILTSAKQKMDLCTIPNKENYEEITKKLLSFAMVDMTVGQEMQNAVEGKNQNAKLPSDFSRWELTHKFVEDNSPVPLIAQVAWIRPPK